MSTAYKFDKFGFLAPSIDTLPTTFRSLDKNFRSIQTKASFSVTVMKEFISASAGVTNFNLPLGSQVTTDYLVVKIDPSANAITIVPSATDLINGALTLVLNKQYQFVWLTFFGGIWYTTAAGSGNINFGSVGPSLVVTNGNLDTVQDIRTTASPVFAKLSTPAGSDVVILNARNDNVAIPNTSLFRLTTGGAAAQISGFVAGVDGQRIVVINGTGSSVAFLPDDANSTAANRIYTAGLATITLSNLGFREFIYSTAYSRWILNAAPST